MKRLAFYGGSFDPVHRGHVAVAAALLEQFALERFTFIPAFHAPHKMRSEPTSAYDRYTMLCLATQNDPKMFVSRMEIEMPERPFSVETLARLNEQFPNDEIFFVVGADSWAEITAWREWEKVLSLSNHIVVTRPGITIATDHVTDEIRGRIVDLREKNGGVAADHILNAPEKQSFSAHRAAKPQDVDATPHSTPRTPHSIYITDAVNLAISATEIRRKIREDVTGWQQDVPETVANYIEKYQIYK